MTFTVVADWSDTNLQGRAVFFPAPDATAVEATIISGVLCRLDGTPGVPLSNVKVDSYRADFKTISQGANLGTIPSISFPSFADGQTVDLRAMTMGGLAPTYPFPAVSVTPAIGTGAITPSQILGITSIGTALITAVNAAAARTVISAIDAATATSMINSAITNLINGSPTALNTLKELADALGDDQNFATTITNLIAGKQPLDSDLTAIAALTPANDDIIQRKAGAWINRTIAQLKTDLTLVKADVGLGNVDNTSDTNKPVSTAQSTAIAAAQAAAIAASQPVDSDLTAIAALSTTSYGRSLLAQADAAAARTTLGAMASMATTAVKTSAYTAAVSDIIPADASTGSFTITLPSAPSDKARVNVKRIDNVNYNTVTVTAGGSDVFNAAGGSTSLTLTLQFQAIQLQYTASTGIWYVISTDVPLGALDTTTAARKRNWRFAEGLSRPTQRLIYPPDDAPTVSYVSGGTNSQILTSTPIFVSTTSTNAIDVLANGLVSVMGACNPQHANATWPNTLIYRFYDCVLNQLNSHSRFQFSLHFYSDSDKVELIHKNIGAGAYRVWVDDQVINSLTPVTFPSTGSTASIMISFPTARMRRYRVDYSNADFVGMFINSGSSPAAYNIWPAEQRGPTVFFMGDSMFGGSGMSTSAIAQIPNYMGTLFGWDNVYNMAQGGTGYTTHNGSGGFDNSALPQVQYLAPSNATPSLTAPGSALPTPDLVVLEWGHNDTWNSTTQTVATTTITAARTQWPNAMIILTGPLAGGFYIGTFESVETTLFTNNARLVDGTISMWQGAARPWMTGSGTTAAPTGNGNSDLYIGSDAVHPNDLGIAYFSERFAPEFRRLLA